MTPSPTAKVRSPFPGLHRELEVDIWIDCQGFLRINPLSGTRREQIASTNNGSKSEIAFDEATPLGAVSIKLVFQLLTEEQVQVIKNGDTLTRKLPGRAFMRCLELAIGAANFTNEYQHWQAEQD